MSENTHSSCGELAARFSEYYRVKRTLVEYGVAARSSSFIMTVFWTFVKKMVLRVWLWGSGCGEDVVGETKENKIPPQAFVVTCGQAHGQSAAKPNPDGVWADRHMY